VSSKVKMFFLNIYIKGRIHPNLAEVNRLINKNPVSLLTDHKKILWCPRKNGLTLLKLLHQGRDLVKLG
jgi:hypothetical protein